MSAGENITIQASGAVGYLEIGALTTPATPANGIGRYYAKEVSTVTHAFFIGDDGTEFDLTTGAEVTTWTADHNAADFDLLQVDNITSGADNTHNWDLQRTATLADNQIIGNIRFRANDGEGAPVVQNYATIEGKLDNDAIGTEDKM